eukprot:scaffold7406_cov753-Prasinococcus_capsulatus_cf.AAC.1
MDMINEETEQEWTEEMFDLRAAENAQQRQTRGTNRDALGEFHRSVLHAATMADLGSYDSLYQFKEYVGEAYNEFNMKYQTPARLFPRGPPRNTKMQNAELHRTRPPNAQQKA